MHSRIGVKEMEFYKILQDIMAEKNMGIPDVARACGLSDSTVRSIIDRKAKNVTLEVAFKMRCGLNVSLERLNGDEKIPTPVPESGRPVNIVKIAGRDGSYAEKRLTDEQVKALQTIIDQMPDAPDDL